MEHIDVTAAPPWSRDSLEKFRDATAVVYVDTEARTSKCKTYGEVIDLASAVADLIKRIHKRPRGVGLCMDNGLCMAVAQLGTLWAESHFVPLPIGALDSPAVGLEVQAMLEDVDLILCAPDLVGKIEALAAGLAHRVSTCAIDDAALAHLPSDAPIVGHDRNDASTKRFCTHFTSGTTGPPKPVHSSHAEFGAFATAAAAPYLLTPSSRVFVATSHIFDPSAGMIFASWAAGAAVCLAPWRHTLAHLRASIELTRATHVCSTPAVWALYDLHGEGAADAAPSTILLGGEPMPASLIRLWLRPDVTLVNTYGTTEATVYQFAYRIPPSAASLTDEEIAEHARCLGTPFEGISVEVAARAADDDAADADHDESAAAAAGELVLRGTQVGGAERWSSRPLAPTDHAAPQADAHDPFHAPFFTGDLVRVRPADGLLLFAGRADRQVKLNGRRIELGPIETAIVKVMLPIVDRAVVVPVRGQHLHAFCQVAACQVAACHVASISPGGATDVSWCAGSLTVHAAAVRMLCALELPEHVVPAGISFLTELPVTANGKTDARALSAMAHERGAMAEFTASPDWDPPTGWLRTVAQCWAFELGVPIGRLSATADFRALSGSSLVALRICSHLWALRGVRSEQASSGGVFGEHMGAFSPVRLLSTPILGEYAAMLASGGQDDHAAGGASDNTIKIEGPASDQTLRPLPLSPFDALAAQAVREGACDLLSVLLERSSIDVSSGSDDAANGTTAPTPSNARDGVSGCMKDELLLSAVHMEHGSCAALLLRLGASPNAHGAGGVNVLSMAVQRHTSNKGQELARLLLANGADVRAVDDDMQTAVHHASRTGGDAACLGMLLRSWDGATATGVPPASTAPTGAHKEGEDAPEDGEEDGVCGACGALDKWGRTPLHWATANGHRDAVVALVEAGSDMWLKDHQAESSMDIAERRAECREWLDGQDGARCDRLTLSMLRLMA